MKRYAKIGISRTIEERGIFSFSVFGFIRILRIHPGHEAVVTKRTRLDTELAERRELEKLFSGSPSRFVN